MRPFFSIIIPVYNKERYIKRCLDSVVNQTFANFECILVDDGSTDRSNAICRTYMEDNPFFSLIEKKNGGLSDARNYGLDYATGEYILFLDSDDMLHPKTLELCFYAIAKTQPDVVIFEMCTTNEGSFFDCNNQDVRMYPVSSYNSISKIIKTETGLSVCNKAYKSDIFKIIRFPIGRLFEDQFVICKLIGNGKLTYIEKPLYYYFQDVDNSLSKMKVYSEVYDYLEASIEILKDTIALGFCSEEAEKLVYHRIVLLLTNAYYHEGQFRNCKLGRINEIIVKNKKLIISNIKGKEKLLLVVYITGSRLLKKALIRMRFEPYLYITRKLGIRGN